MALSLGQTQAKEGIKMKLERADIEAELVVAQLEAVEKKPVPLDSATRTMQAFNILGQDNEGGNNDQKTLAYPDDSVAAAAVLATAEGVLTGEVGLRTVAETIGHDDVTMKQQVAEFTLRHNHENEPRIFPANKYETQVALLSSNTDLIVDHSCSRKAEALMKDTRFMMEDQSEQRVFAQKVCITEKEIRADQLERREGDDPSVKHVRFKDLLVGPESEDVATPSRQRKVLSFINVPIDIRRLIYDMFMVPITKTIHITHSPETTVFEVPRPDRHTISKDVLNLFLVFRQVSDELADILYGRNTFVIMPGEQNYNTPITPDPLSNSSVWLAHQRSQTRQKVKKLRIFLDFSLQARIRNIAAILSEYPMVEIAVQPLATSKIRARLQLEHVCTSIQRARIHGRRTAWSNGENPEVARILANALSGTLKKL